MRFIKKFIDEVIWGNEAVINSDIMTAKHRDKLQALEDYLGIEYFNGPKYKPHYRKKKATKGKVGRPRKHA